MTVSIQPAAQQVSDDLPPVEASDIALEFVRFCYRRRRVAWPALYDEMSAVASRSTFRGIHRLKDQQHRPAILCVEPLLQPGHALAALLQHLVGDRLPSGR